MYWTDASLGEEGGPGGDPVVIDPGWFWLRVDNPDHHYLLDDAVTLEEAMSHEDLVAARDDALELAVRKILEHPSD